MRLDPDRMDLLMAYLTLAGARTARDDDKPLSVPAMPVWGAAFLEGLRQLPTTVDGPPCEGA